MTGAPDGLMLFDGVCNFCSGGVKLTLRVDRNGAIRFAPVQSDLGRRLYREHGLDPADPSSFLFFDQGKALTKSTAILAMAGRLPWPWRAARVLGVVPRAWRDAAYGLLARNRYKILGRRETCFLPTPEQRARFVADPSPE